MNNYSFPVTDTDRVTLKGFDAAGNEVPVPAGATLTSSDPATIAVTPGADGSFTLAGVKLGTVTLTAQSGTVSVSETDTTVPGALASLAIVHDPAVAAAPPAPAS